MNIQVKRPSFFFGYGTPIALFHNGKKVTSLKVRDTQSVTVEAGDRLYVQQSLLASQDYKIAATDQMLTIGLNPIFLKYYGLIFLLLLFTAGTPAFWWLLPVIVVMVIVIFVLLRKHFFILKKEEH